LQKGIAKTIPTRIDFSYDETPRLHLLLGAPLIENWEAHNNKSLYVRSHSKRVALLSRKQDFTIRVQIASKTNFSLKTELNSKKMGYFLIESVENSNTGVFTKEKR